MRSLSVFCFVSCYFKFVKNVVWCYRQNREFVWNGNLISCFCQNRGRSGSKLSAVKVESERFQKCHNRGLWRILSRWKLLFVVQAVRLNRFLDLWLNCLVSRYRESEDGCYVFFVIIVNLRLLLYFFWTGVHLAIGVIKSWRRIPRRWRAVVVGEYP